MDNTPTEFKNNINKGIETLKTIKEIELLNEIE